MLGRQYQGGPVPQGHILAKYRRFENWTTGDKRVAEDLRKLEVNFDAIRQVNSPCFI
jgi:hypothetical protein